MKYFFIYGALICSLNIYAQTNINNDECLKDVFVVVDTQPKYRGGDKELLKYIKSKSIYKIVKNGKNVTYLYIVICKSGKVSFMEAKNKTDVKFSDEAQRIAEFMPEWDPGLKNGEKVNTQIVIPIHFK